MWDKCLPHNNSLCLSVRLFHFLSKTTDLIGLKFYNSLRNNKVHSYKQDGVCYVHKLSLLAKIVSRNLNIFILYLLVAPHLRVRKFMGM